MSDKSCCCHKKYRSDEEKKKLIHRLNRIEGQIRGLRGMLEDDAYCMDILVQSSAASAALTAFNRELLSTHIESCVVDGIRQGDDEIVEELLSILQKMQSILFRSFFVWSGYDYVPYLARYGNVRIYAHIIGGIPFRDPSVDLFEIHRKRFSRLQ